MSRQGWTMEMSVLAGHIMACRTNGGRWEGVGVGYTDAPDEWQRVRVVLACTQWIKGSRCDRG